MSRTAFITGATSGIGAAFARKLASENYDLIITGRRAEKINALAEELRAKYKIKVEVMLAELSDENVINALETKIKNLDDLELLVNNAGFGVKGVFFQNEIAPYENMLKAHALATMKFTHAALPKMLANKKGAIINVSSVVAFFPWMRSIVYGATKAFINLFTETLYLELKGTGVRIQVLCPGITDTDFFAKMETSAYSFAHMKMKIFKPMSPEVVVERSLLSLSKNKAVCIPGMINKLAVFFGGLFRLL